MRLLKAVALSAVRFIPYCGEYASSYASAPRSVL